MKKRYVPDVKSMNALCETNYFRLYRLTAGDATLYEYQVESPQGHKAEIKLEIIEAFKFTTTIQVSIHHHGFPDAIGKQQLLVRCYSDVRMAEVVASGHGHQFSGVYPYPNEQMFQVDEKIQLNKYLAEWLAWLQNNGQVSSSP